MPVKGKDFKKAVAFIKEFLSKLPQDSDCAELRDSLNFALLHMKKYFKTVWLQNQEKPSQKLTSTSLHGGAVTSKFMQASADHFYWKWVNVSSSKGVSKSLPLDGKQLPTIPLVLQAAKEGDKSLIKQLIEKEPSCVKAKDEYGRTAVLYAVHYNQNDCLETLLNGGANPDEASSDGVTAVHVAAMSNNYEALRVLLRHGADPTLQDSLGRTALHWATTLNEEECMQILFKCNIQFNMRDQEGLSPAMWSCRHDCKHHFENLINHDDYQIQEEDLIERDRRGRTWIHWSVNAVGSYDCLQSLLSSETVAIKDNSGRTALHLAAESGSVEACKIILSSMNPDVGVLQMADKQGRTCLELATLGGHGEVISCLLEQGADICHKDSLNKSSLDYARERDLHYCHMLLQSYHDMHQYQLKKLKKTEQELNNNNQTTYQGNVQSTESPLIFKSVPPPKPGLSPRMSNLTKVEDLDDFQDDADVNRKSEIQREDNEKEVEKKSVELVQYTPSDEGIMQSVESCIISSDMQPSDQFIQQSSPSSRPSGGQSRPQDIVGEEIREVTNHVLRSASPESNESNQSLDFGMDVSDIEDNGNGGRLEGKPSEANPPVLVVHPAPSCPSSQQVFQQSPSAPLPRPPDAKLSRDKISQGFYQQREVPHQQQSSSQPLPSFENKQQGHQPAPSPRRLMPLEDNSPGNPTTTKNQQLKGKKKKRKKDTVSPVPLVRPPNQPQSVFQPMRPPSPAFPLSASRSPSPLSKSPTPNSRSPSDRPGTPPPLTQTGFLRVQQKGSSWEASMGVKRPGTPSPPVTPRESVPGPQGDGPKGAAKAVTSGLTRGQTQPMKILQSPRPPGNVQGTKPSSPRGPSASPPSRLPPPTFTSGKNQPFLPSPPGAKPNSS